MIKLLERRDAQCDAIMDMASAAFMPISHLHGMLSVPTSKNEPVEVSPETFGAYMADIKRAEALADKLYEAIKALKIFR
jgi:hypothetical protein